MPSIDRTRIIEVTDTSFRRNVCYEFTKDIREAYFKATGQFIPSHIRFMPAKDKQGRQVQEAVPHTTRYTGDALVNAIKRAKRWLLHQHSASRKPPSHIRRALVVMGKYEEEFGAVS